MMMPSLRIFKFLTMERQNAPQKVLCIIRSARRTMQSYTMPRERNGWPSPETAYISEYRMIKARSTSFLGKGTFVPVLVVSRGYRT